MQLNFFESLSLFNVKNKVKMQNTWKFERVKFAVTRMCVCVERAKEENLKLNGMEKKGKSIYFSFVSRSLNHLSFASHRKLQYSSKTQHTHTLAHLNEK